MSAPLPQGLIDEARSVRIETVKAPATVPELLDYLYLNVELDLRIAGLKAIAAAVDLEIGDSDDAAERNIRLAIDHLRAAAAGFRQIKDAKAAAGAAILAEAAS